MRRRGRGWSGGQRRIDVEVEVLMRSGYDDGATSGVVMMMEDGEFGSPVKGHQDVELLGGHSAPLAK